LYRHTGSVNVAQAPYSLGCSEHDPSQSRRRLDRDPVRGAHLEVRAREGVDAERGRDAAQEAAGLLEVRECLHHMGSTDA